MLKQITTLLTLCFALISSGCGGGDSQTPLGTTTGTHYYVTKEGNDGNDGTENHPFKTIQRAADSVIAGDTVLIKAGVYNERVEILHSGTTNKIITFKNYPQDTQNKVIIDGDGITWGAWGGLFDVSNQSYINVSGLRLINSSYAGFFVENSQNILIENSETYNTFSSGIGVWESDSITINNNEVELACNDGGDESITIATSSNSVVSNNEVHHNGAGTIGGEGIDIKDGSHDVEVYGNHVHHLNGRIGIYIDAWNKHTYAIKVYANRVHHCNDSGIAAATEMGGLLEDVSFYNNVVYANKYGGIEVGGWTAEPSITHTPIKNIKIINNTLYNNIDGINIDNKDAMNITIQNNITSQNTGEQIAINATSQAEIRQDHNLLHSTGSALNDPLFEDPENDNFRLTINSPAIDAGIETYAPNKDYEGNSRPKNHLWDIGAYEF